MADRVRPPALEVAHPNAAGIDIGSGSHFVAVRADAEERPVREFLSFTEDLEALAQIAKRLPLDARIPEALGRYAPKGLVERKPMALESMLTPAVT